MSERDELELLIGNREHFLDTLYSRMESGTDRVARELADVVSTRIANGTLSVGKLHLLPEYRLLTRQLSVVTQVYARTASKQVAETAREASDLAADHLRARGQTPRLKRYKVPAAVGRALREMTREQRDAVDSALLDVLAQKRVRPDVLARRLQDVARMVSTRAQLFARDQATRAYRSVLAAGYAKDKTVTGWVWTARLDPSTCAVCWALHGTVHPDSEPMVSHPRCRCYPESISEPTTVPLGADMFESLTVEQKRAILGPAKYRLYLNGMPISDLVGHAHSDEYGKLVYEKSLKQLTRKVPSRG